MIKLQLLVEQIYMTLQICRVVSNERYMNCEICKIINHHMGEVWNKYEESLYI